jgi:cytochrome c oxidase subunit 2
VHKLWSILFGVILLGAFLLFCVSPALHWWLPPDISPNGYQVDFLFYLILALTGFFYVLTCGLLVLFIWQYSGEARHKPTYTHGNHRLEWFWTIVVGVLLLVIGIVQIPAWAGYKYEADMPQPKHIFEVSARQFEWRIRYPSKTQLEHMIYDWQRDQKVPASVRLWEKAPLADDIHVVNEVHTWKDAKVRFFLKSRDVIHSFFLPNLRLKQDALPGKTIPVWFEAKQANIEWDRDRREWKPFGATWDESKSRWAAWDEDKQELVEKKWVQWDLACAELCGWGHGRMQGRLFVHKDQLDYEEWLRQAQDNEMSRVPSDLDKPKAPKKKEE